MVLAGALVSPPAAHPQLQQGSAADVACSGGCALVQLTFLVGGVWETRWL